MELIAKLKIIFPNYFEPSLVFKFSKIKILALSTPIGNSFCYVCTLFTLFKTITLL
jgi:hypothetical protein